MTVSSEKKIKVVIITGASAGIGRATAVRLARDGMRLTLLARRKELLADLATEVESLGGEALVFPADVRDRDAIHQMVGATLERWARIDVLVNNAGVSYTCPVAELNPQRLRDTLDTNLLGVIECTQAVLPAMMHQKSGQIINVASIAGLIGIPHSTIYSTSKFGVVGFSDGLRREVSRHGVKVTTFCPGYVATDLSPRLQRIAERHPQAEHLPGVMTPEYVAERIARLIFHPRRRQIIPPGWGIIVWLAQSITPITDFVISRANF